VKIFYLYPQNLLFFLTGSVNLLVGVYLYARNRFNHNPFFLPFFLFVFLWSFGIGIRSSIIGVEAKTFWTNLAYIGIVMAPVCLLLAVRDLMGNPRLRHSQLFLFLMTPSAIIILIFTDPYHHLFWSYVSEQPNNFNYLLRRGGLVYWFNAVYQFSLVAYMIYLLLKPKFTKFHQLSARYILLSIIPPTLTNLLFIFNVTYIPNFNLSPLGFLFTAIILLIGFLRLELFNLPQIGLNRYLDLVQHGLVIADVYGTVGLINPFARKILDLKPGQKLTESVVIQEALDRVDSGNIDSHQFETFFKDELYYIDLTLTPLKNTRDVIIGQQVLLNNITEVKKISNFARVSQISKIKAEERERIAKELQDRIAQGLYTLTLFIKSAQKNILDGIIQRTYQDLEELDGMTNQLVKKVGLLYYELDDNAFGKIGLIQALSDQIEIQKYQSNISIDVVNFDKVSLDLNAQRTTYGIIVSVLNEILKLSKPKSIVININETSKNFMIKFMIYERELQAGLLTQEMIELKFLDVIESIENINGVFEFEVITTEQKLINIQIPRK